MFKLINVCADFGRLKDYPRSRYVEAGRPLVFSWGAIHDGADAVQSACRVKLLAEGLSYDSGWVETSRQQFTCEGVQLPEGAAVNVAITIRDNKGAESETYINTIWNTSVAWDAEWVGAQEDIDNKTLYLRKEFRICKPVADAVLYACGIGYQKAFINGVIADDAELDPANTDFTKTCQYVMYTGIAGSLRMGDNCIGAMVGSGWRRNVLTANAHREFADGSFALPFDGALQFTAMLKIVYQDGEVEWIRTGEDWEAGEGAHTSSDVFNGEVYDANKTAAGWNLPGFKGFSCAKVLPAPGGVMRPMILNPIIAHKVRKPIAWWPIGEDSVVVDFGQNLAGVVRVKLPACMKAGQKITVGHAEELDEDGTLYTAPLRRAAAADTYIASGDGRDIELWQPIFTYHGFRYARIDGMGNGFDADCIEAIELHTDLEINSTFRCGDAQVTRIHEACVETERGNQHSILTDCPQRDERQGWMNDATVRFEETPYNFDIGRMFPKLIRDIVDTQSADGAMTCTAPYVFGFRPADPVCSSFLVAGYESYLHLDNEAILAEAFDAFAGWENCLLANSTDWLVNYGHYGDWAGPAYACKKNSMGDGAESIVTPSEFMSSGYSYYNCKRLSEFAKTLGNAEAEALWAERAENVKNAMLAKWYEPGTGKMCTGSEGCQTFALWLGLIPEEDTAKAAKLIHDDLIANDFHFTTGNLCTRYIMDVLSRYGYLEDAWTLITKQTYPSYGYMIEQEATTIWERFELKKDPGMNSHNHPMFGSVDYWFYAYLCGIQPDKAGCEHIHIEPYFPEKLMSAQGVVDTAKGQVAVRWMKRYDKTHLHVTVPFGATATVVFAGQTYEVGSGFHAFSA